MNDVLEHCRAQWEEIDGQLTVGGVPVGDAVAMAGGTPAYLYARDSIASAVERTRQALPGAELFYSIKANSFSPILCYLADLVDGFDVASTGELLRALNAGKGRESIQFSGPGKRDSEISQSVNAGIVINVESQSQAAAVAAAARESEKEARVVLRVNPRDALSASGLRMGGAGSQFGIDPEFIPSVIDYCRRVDLEPLGFHFYWGTQCLDGELIAAAQRGCWDIARSLADNSDLDLRYLNLGGGFGIPYYDGDEPLELGAVKGAVAEIGGELKSRIPNARLIVELGRYLVGAAGIYVVRVVDVKVSGGTKIAITDGGMHQHLAASGNLGQGLRRSFPCYTPAQMRDAAEERFRVVGCLCTPIDILSPDADLPPIEIGSLIGIFQSGAYAATASPQGFLSHEPVTELLL